MPRFAYRAKDSTLRLVEGTIEAESEAAAVSRLGGQGLFPISLAEGEAAAATTRPVFGRRVSPLTLAYATRQLVDLLGGGLPLLSALTLLAKQTEMALLRRVIESLAASVREGQSFSDALSRYPQVFPPLYISMVKAGEVGGGLEQSLARLAELGEHEAELRSRVRNAAAYPLFVLCLALALIVFLLVFVIPNLSLVFTETNQVLPWPTRFLLGLSAVFRQGWWAIAGGLVASGWMVRRGCATARGRALIDRAVMAVPVLGGLVRKVETSRVTRSLGTMIGQGVPILQALRVVSETVGGGAVRQALTQVGEAVREGFGLAAALSATQQFPVFVRIMVAAGEESGTVDAALLKVAVAYEREVDRSIQLVTTILEPLLLVVVGGVVMFIVLAMLLPIFELSGGLAQ